jgi:DNA-binding response OmpR family regulator
MRALRILVVEPAAESKLAQMLGRGGHEILSVGERERPTRLLGVFDPDVIVIAAPDGPPICRALREAAPDHGILMVAASADPEDRVAALRAGANDCVATPFAPIELLARVEAVWRRTRRAQNRPRNRQSSEPKDRSQPVSTSDTKGEQDRHAKTLHEQDMQPNPTKEQVSYEMNDQIEDDVRAVLYDKAESVPDQAIERLRSIDYNPVRTDTHDRVRGAVTRLIDCFRPRRSSGKVTDEDGS